MSPAAKEATPWPTEARQTDWQFTEGLQVKPGSQVTLAKDFDPGFKGPFPKKKDGAAQLRRGVEILAEYQARLAAQDTYGGVLVVLQALDAGARTARSAT